MSEIMADELSDRLDEIVGNVDISSSAMNKYDELEEVVSGFLGLQVDDLYTVGTSSDKAYNILNRLSQGKGLKRHHPLGLVVLGEASEADGVRYSKRMVGRPPERRYGAIGIILEKDGKWTVSSIVESGPRKISEKLLEAFPGARLVDPDPLDEEYGPPVAGEPTAFYGAGEGEILVDERTRRMVETAVCAYPAVILVGPPGTGKTFLLKEIHQDAVSDPGKYNLSKSPRDLQVRTPDDSWTALELVGGLTVDRNHDLVFRPGAVLDAIRTNRWLMLDELNRADMDKIFGPLLTWLSGVRVELGKASTDLDAPDVVLQWGSKPECDASDADRLDEVDPGSDPIEFTAGAEWRLLGTYNDVDAHRVFRFGQALMRRFRIIPIKPPEPQGFDDLVEQRLAKTPQGLRAILSRLYSAHYEDPRTRLGPAAFLEITRYTAAAAGKQQIELPTDPPPSSASEASGAEPFPERTPAPESFGDNELRSSSGDASGESSPGAKRTGDDEARTQWIPAWPLISEAYLMSVGKYVARYDIAEREQLGHRLVDSNALPEAEWDWIAEQIGNLA